MEFERKQDVLFYKFLFRIFVLIFSLWLCRLYACYFAKTTTGGILLGVGGSAIVWSLVEIVDFFIQTFSQFEQERNHFLGLVNRYFIQMKNIIRKNKNNVPMHEMKSVVEELYEELNKYIFANNVYPISKEFQECCNYITRMYWKFTACCVFINDNCKEKDKYYQKLYESIILIEVNQEDVIERFEEGYITRNKFDEMTNIELSFVDYEVPENIVKEDTKGDLGKSYKYPDNISEVISFVPSIHFQKIFAKKRSNMIFAVAELIFRKVKTKY